MTRSETRYQGVSVVFDTTDKAEFDIKGYQLTDAFIDSVARQLKEVTFSDIDREVGSVRVREIDGYDFVFFVGREAGQVVVTLGAVRLANPENPTERILQNIGVAAMFRGATGV